MVEDKILNNSFNSVEFGTEGLRNTPIAIHPAVSDIYEESTTENIEDVHVRKELEQDIYQLYVESDFYKKYGQDCKKIERPDIPLIYHYFKHKLQEKKVYNAVQIFCMIAEFFDLNYKILYNDIISLEEKATILTLLENSMGLETEFESCGELF